MEEEGVGCDGQPAGAAGGFEGAARFGAISWTRRRLGPPETRPHPGEKRCHPCLYALESLSEMTAGKGTLEREGTFMQLVTRNYRQWVSLMEWRHVSK